MDLISSQSLTTSSLARFHRIMAMSHERPLRVFTLLTTTLATPLLIALTIISVKHDNIWPYRHGYRKVTAFCFAYIPLALTAAASAISIRHHRKHQSAPGPRLVLLDGLAGIVYLSIIIPICAVEVGALAKPGFGLLAGYLIALMFANMCVHFAFSAFNARSAWLLLAAPRLHKCPNCHNSFTASASDVKETTNAGQGYSLLRGEEYLDTDADAEVYAGVSARSSEEQTHPDKDKKDEVQVKTFIDV